MLYGIQASGDTQLSSIVRAIDDDIEPIYTEKRLSRNIDNKDLERLVSSAILAEGARHVKQDTLILVDPTEIRKEFGYKMEYVTRVRDASRSSKEGHDVLEYGFENIRVQSYNGIRNMASLVLAAAYFSTVWIGRHLKHKVLAEHLARLNKRLNEVPQFAAYAITSGIKRAFSAFGRLVERVVDVLPVKKTDAPLQLMSEFMEYAEWCDG